MKKIKWVVLVSALTLVNQAISDVPHNFRYKQSDLHIFAISPPALIYVVNANGQRAGADPLLPMNSDGTQGDRITGLTEIPLSHVIQNNDSAFDGTDFEQKTDTTWNIEVYDSGPQTFTINIKGIVVGDEPVAVTGIYRGKGNKPSKTSFDVLVSPGQTRQVQVVFNPINKTISFQRIVGNSDLLTDVKIACQLNLISPSGICQSLEAKADTVVRDAQNNDTKSEIQHEQVFLKELQVVGKNHIKEPAFTILQDEAQTLLNTLNGGQPQASSQPPPAGNCFEGILGSLSKIFG